MDFLCVKFTGMVIAILAEKAFREKTAGSPALPVKDKAAAQHAAEGRQQTHSKKKEPPAAIIWADSLRSLTIIDADVYMDLLFDFDRERISRLESLLPKTVLVYAANAVAQEEINHLFIHILEIRALRKGNRATIAARDPAQEKTASRVFDALGWDCRFIKEKRPKEKMPGGRAYLLSSAQKPQPGKRDKQK